MGTCCQSRELNEKNQPYEEQNKAQFNQRITTEGSNWDQLKDSQSILICSNSQDKLALRQSLRQKAVEISKNYLSKEKYRILGNGINRNWFEVVQMLTNEPFQMLKFNLRGKKNWKLFINLSQILNSSLGPYVAWIIEILYIKKTVQVILPQFPHHSLKQYISEKEKSEKDIIKMFRAILTALQYLECQNQAIPLLKTEQFYFTIENKPSSLKFLRIDQLKLLSDIDSINRFKKNNIIYAPPEYFKGKFNVSHQNMWQVGLLFFEIVTEQFPFSGSSQKEIISSITNFNPLKTYEFGQYSPKLLSFIVSLLAKNPAKRLTLNQALMHEYIADNKVVQLPRSLKQNILSYYKLTICKRAILCFIRKFMPLHLFQKEIKWFQFIDKDKSMTLSAQEIEAILDQQQNNIWQKRMPDSVSISYEQFLSINMKKYLNKELIKKCFLYIDVDQKGYLDRNDFDWVLRQFDSDWTVEQIFDSIWKDIDCQIDFVQFEQTLISREYQPRLNAVFQKFQKINRGKAQLIYQNQKLRTAL